MRVTPIRTRIFRENEDLVSFVHMHIKKIPEGSVLVVASKIVGLSEGRFVLNPGYAHKGGKDRLMRKESQSALKTKHAWLTIKGGMMMANAGIDESNANGMLVLLPKDSFASAEHLRKKLKKTYKVRNLGVVISDSAIAPLRAGVTAHALGYSGIKGIRDYRRKKDLFGRIMRLSRTNVADSLATVAALAMGEGDERQPLALISEAPVVFTEKTDKKETLIPARDDIYWPLLKNLKPHKRKK